MSSLLPVLHRIGTQAALAIAVVLAALLASAVLKRLINRRLKARHLAPVMAERLHTLRRWTVGVLTILMLLEVFDVFGSAWALISAGLAAVAVGFVAAWSVLSNVTAALLLLTFRPFRLGERIELLEPGSSNSTPLGGKVVDMNLMYTTLSPETLDPDGEPGVAYLRVPNFLFFQKVIRTPASDGPVNRSPFFTPPAS